MAIKKEIWDKAKLLFEYGKSLSEIQKETGINRSTISKKSKEESWQKSTENSTLIQQEIDTTIKQVEIGKKKSTLNQQQLILHNKEVLVGINKHDFSLAVHGVAGEIVSVLQKSMQQTIKYINDDEEKCQEAGKESTAAIEMIPTVMVIAKTLGEGSKIVLGQPQAYDPDADKGADKAQKRYIISPEDEEDE